MNELQELIEKAARETRKSRGSLWKAPYNLPTAESSFKFLTECCWTYNEADASIELIPPLDYIRWVCEEFWKAHEAGQAFIIEKSRRLIMSWVMRGLELHIMGLGRSRGVLAGLNYPKAAEHVWRYYHLYETMRAMRPDMRLDKCESRGGNPATQMLDMVVLPNGSLVQKLNQDGESFQGSGFTFVSMEEFSLYKEPEYMFGQAKFVTQGKAGGNGGMIIVITNASPNPQWKEIKA